MQCSRESCPVAYPLPTGMTWDGQQLVIVDTGGDEIWTLARNADGSYTPGNAALSGIPALWLGRSNLG